MLIPSSPERIIALVKHRLPFVFLGAAIVALGSSFIGLTSPYLYRTEAVVQVVSNIRSSDPELDETQEIQVAAALAKSPEVLLQIAKSINNQVASRLSLAVPRSISFLDFKEKKRNLFANLLPFGMQLSSNLQPIKSENNSSSLESNQNAELSSEVLASLLSQNLRAEPDVNLKAVRIAYEGGDPWLTQLICSKISSEFVRHLIEVKNKEIQFIEESLQKAILEQLSSLNRSEEQMKEMMYKYPFLAVSDSKGSQLIGQKYLGKLDAEKRMRLEAETVQKALHKVRTALMGQNETDLKLKEQLKGKIIQEIAELEFKIVQYTKGSGYSESHPAVTALKNKIQGLNKSLSSAKQVDADQMLSERTINMESDQEPFETLTQRYSDLREKKQKITTEREIVNRELADQNLNFREVTSASFAFDAIVRELNVKITILNELYQQIQKNKIVAMNIASKIKILSHPILPVHSSGVSLSKRIAFSIPVGLALALSVLILLELLKPTLLCVSDFKTIGVNHFGNKKFKIRDFSRLASYISSLEAPIRDNVCRTANIIALYPVSVTFNFSNYTSRLIKEVHNQGKKVGLVTIYEPESHVLLENAVPKDIESIEISTDKVAACLSSEIDKLSKTCEIVFITSPVDVNSPCHLFISKTVNYFLYLTEIGKSRLESVESIKSLSESNKQIKHYAVMLGWQK